VEYWKDKKFVNSIRRYEPQKFSGFDKKRTVVESFEKLFESAKEIPHWLISYNNRSYPSVDEFRKLVSKYRDVEVEYKTYENGRGGKGSVAGSREVLLICRKRLSVNIPFEARGAFNICMILIIGSAYLNPTTSKSLIQIKMDCCG